MVVGGSAGWSKVRRFLALSGSALGLSAGCGSRTSLLGQEDFIAHGGDGATGSGGSGGSAAGGKGGSANDPNAVDPTRAELPCMRYCMGYQSACAAMLGGRECVSTCVAEASSKGKDCQTFAIGVLDCFAPFFIPGESCDSANLRGSAKCEVELGRYNQCLSDTSNVPVAAPQPINCSMYTSGSLETCFELLTCEKGDYAVECSLSPSGGRRCTCTWPNGSKSFEYGATTDGCVRARADCGLN